MPSLGLVLGLKFGRNYELLRSFFILPSYKLTSSHVYTQPGDLSSLQTGDCSYNDQCSVFSKTAFVQIGPQNFNQSGRILIIFAR